MEIYIAFAIAMKTINILEISTCMNKVNKILKVYNIWHSKIRVAYSNSILTIFLSE